MRRQVRDITILVVVLFAVFSPTLTAQLFQIDDRDMYRWLVNHFQFDVFEVIFPSGYQAGYYRPLLQLTYLWDKHVWQCSLPLMHLDNIAFHIANSYLVYYLASVLLERRGVQTQWLPVAAGLTFGLHPVVTESVAWISGRTDILACTFLLTATIFFLKGIADHRTDAIIAAAVAAVLGILVKETAITAAIAAVILLPVFRHPDTDEPTSGRELKILLLFGVLGVVLLLVTYSFIPVALVAVAAIVVIRTFCRRQETRAVTRTLFSCVGGLCIGVSLFWIMRTVAFSSSTTFIGRTLNLIASDPEYALKVFLGALAFYLKKFFIPIPLNFAIAEIDPLYQPAGILVLFVLVYFLLRPTLPGRLFLTGFVFILPVLPLTFGTIAWTPYAERYIYIPTAYWILAFVCWGAHKLERYRYGALALGSVVMITALITLDRNALWRTNVGICGDSASKSPQFLPIHSDYMLSLFEAGRLADARAEYQVASKIPTIGYNPNLDLQLASVCLQEGNFNEGFRIFEEAAFKTKLKHAKTLDLLVSNLLEYIPKVKDRDRLDFLLNRLDFFADKLFRIEQDAERIYYLGKFMLHYSEKEAAIRYFKLAGRCVTGDQQYRNIAQRALLSVTAGES